MSGLRERGFSAVEVVIAVFVVAAIGTTAYLAYDRMKEANKTPTASEQVQNGSAPSAPEIGQSKDLDTASKALDDTNVDAGLTDSAELDVEANNF